MESSNLKDLGISEKEFDIIKRLISIKTKELDTYFRVRYALGNIQVSKVDYERNQIVKDLDRGDFNQNFKVAYLKVLKDEIIRNDIQIIEYRPHDDYNGTNDFLNWIDKQLIHFEIKEINGKTESLNNPHPSIFENGAFNIFEKWMELSSDKPEKKISFIFQKLKEDKKLRNTNFKSLSNWALEHNYLDETTFQKLSIRGYFDTPSKILTKSRLELYHSITDA